MLDPLASGEFHAQEGTRALRVSGKGRRGGDPHRRAGLRGCPEDLLSIGEETALS